jgi:hypothetical protein
MSKRVIFTCTLLFLLGVAGCVDSASAFLRGQAHFNLFALFLPVALVLFLGLPGSRMAATVVFSIHYLFLAFLLLGSSFVKVSVVTPDLAIGSSWSLILVFVAMLGSLLVLLHWMLFSPPFEEHLNL